jgi:hypothetical protein
MNSTANESARSIAALTLVMALSFFAYFGVAMSAMVPTPVHQALASMPSLVCAANDRSQ